MNVERLRRGILKHLYGCPAFTDDARDLKAALANDNLRPTIDQLRAELVWLASVDCVIVGEAGSRVNATLTERGVEVYKDQLQIPGIERPASPKAVLHTSTGIAADILKGA